MMMRFVAQSGQQLKGCINRVVLVVQRLANPLLNRVVLTFTAIALSRYVL